MPAIFGEIVGVSNNVGTPSPQPCLLHPSPTPLSLVCLLHTLGYLIRKIYAVKMNILKIKYCWVNDATSSLQPVDP